MNCPKCNNTIQDGHLYCNECGTKVISTRPPSVDAPIPPQAPPPSVDTPITPQVLSPSVDIPISPQVQQSGGLSAAAKWIIGIAAVVVVAMVVVFLVVILPQLGGGNTQAAAISESGRDEEEMDAEDDSADDEAETEAADDAAADEAAEEPVHYTLDVIGKLQYGVFVGQGGKYFPVYMPQAFNEYDFSFEAIDYDMIPSMAAGDMLVHTNVDNVEFTISPVTKVDSGSLEVEGLGRYVLKTSDDHVGSDIQVFALPSGMALSYAQLYYVHAKDIANQNARPGFTGLVYIQDTAFDAPQGNAPVSSDYILAGSDERYISESELWPLSQWQVRLARNEIYARYGYDFKTDSIQLYFENTSWYQNDPYYGHSANKPKFNDCETYNLNLIRSYEKSLEQGDSPAYSGYILPGSDQRYISESELWPLTQWETRLARNEIYARYGYNFKTSAIQQYFDSMSWYWDDPYYGYDANKPSFNQYETYNISVIKSYEASMGW